LMYPDIFQLAKNSPAVTALLGSNPVRFWPFGTAPQGEERPYAVHQLVYGNPNNTLSCPPSEDVMGVQIACYAEGVRPVGAVAAGLRDAIGGDFNRVVAGSGEDFEPATGRWRVSFTAEFFVEGGS